MNHAKKEELKKWISTREWYQTMELGSGIHIKGKAPTYEREKYLKESKLDGKSVIDIGCNSGQFCFFAEHAGADRIVGIDIEEERIEEAKVLGNALSSKAEFRIQSIFDLPQDETYDIVYCFAVVTEIQDILGALGVLKRAMQEALYLELDLAKPVLYFSISKNWRSPSIAIPRMRAVAEVRSSHGRMVFSPSLAVLREFFGEGYQVEYLGKGARYDMVRIRKVTP